MNIIKVLAAGDRELFHSAFLAWLMDRNADHGLGSSFLEGLGSDARKIHHYDPTASYEIETEFPLRGARLDILLKPTGCTRRNGLVFENKVKAFGGRDQVERYADLGFDVSVLTLLEEMVDPGVRRSYPVITYETVRSILDRLPLDPTDHFQFLVGQYRDYLASVLGWFEMTRRFARGRISPSEFRRAAGQRVTRGETFSENDIRTFTYVYYHGLASWLSANRPELVFGVETYQAAEAANAAGQGARVNTRWEIEKNVRGPAFMEALIHDPFRPEGGFRMNPEFESLYRAKPFTIAPRLEVRLDPAVIGRGGAGSVGVGRVLLGSWDARLKAYYQRYAPYRETLVRLGPRNDHKEELTLVDLPFEKMANRLASMLARVGSLRGPR